MKRLVTSVDLNADDRRKIEEAWPEEADECLRAVAGWVLFPFALVLCAVAVLFTREG